MRKRRNRGRRYTDGAFGAYLVIGFIIQVHDFNFPLFLSKAGGAAGGRLLVSWITAYEMSRGALSQCLDDIMGMEMRQEEQSICTVTPSFNHQKPTISHCLQKPSLFPHLLFSSEAISNLLSPKALYSRTKKDNMPVKPYRTSTDE